LRAVSFLLFFFIALLLRRLRQTCFNLTDLVISGRTTINNRSVVINTDFARQVVFVSTHLDVSERYVAALLQSITSRHPNITSQQAPISDSEKLVEAAIMEFHAKRRQLAECLKYIVEAAVSAQRDDLHVSPGSKAETGRIAEVYRQLELFVRQEILILGRTPALVPPNNDTRSGGSTGGVATQQGFPMRVLQEIDKIGETIESVRVAGLNARSDTIGPSQTQGESIDRMWFKFDHLNVT
jgi:nuclear pore complex protein Nup205